MGSCAGKDRGCAKPSGKAAANASGAFGQFAVNRNGSSFGADEIGLKRRGICVKRPWRRTGRSALRILDFRFSPPALRLAALTFGLAAAAGANAANYEFLACPATDLNRVYRLDRATGEIGACQYGLKDGSAIGVTLCYPSGDGAGPQSPSEYSLVATRHNSEAGVFRVDLRTGMMSVCYVLNEAVVCTPSAR
jgi:hypothetical protein